MRQHGYGRDTGLTFRMFFTMFMLAGLWVVFMGLLFWAGISPILIFGFALIGVLIQYFMSDKLVLMSTGAHERSPRRRSPGCTRRSSDLPRCTRSPSRRRSR